jgi:hypothetical protein
MVGRRSWWWSRRMAHARSTGIQDERRFSPLPHARMCTGPRFLGITQMVGHRWTRPICHAWAKSRGRPCRRPVGRRRDGTFHVVCWSHGSNTPPYSERPISEAGKQRISAAAKLMWKTYRERKSGGLPVWQVGRKRKPVPPPRPAPRKPVGRPVILTEQDRAFAKLIGMRLPEKE